MNLTRPQSRLVRCIDALRAHWLSSAPPRSPNPEAAAMMQEPQPDITQLLFAWRNGDAQALEQLTPLVYEELRRLAARYLRRERAGHTLQATALVNEAYLQLIAQPQVDWQSRAHFIGIAARLMRQILVDHARAHAAAKRGAGVAAVPLNEILDTPARTRRACSG
jgi:RNA polymerase sigma factor (TIGR02999 family)